jgi:hypothetical protein
MPTAALPPTWSYRIIYKTVKIITVKFKGELFKESLMHAWYDLSP